jgi:hypothetical protein
MSNGIGKNPLNDISKVYLESIANQQEGYKPIDKKKETAMYRRAGNLARTSLSSKGKEKEDAQEKSGKIVSAITKQKEDERFERIGKDPKHQNNYKEALDPVGREDADVDNDGKKNTKSDKYLLKRRAAISKALASTKNGVRKEQTEIAEIHSQAHTPHEIPSGDLKKLVKKAVKRIDTDVDGDTDKNDKAKGELGEFIPGVGNKRLYSTTGTKTAKESFSNWRGDLTEIMTDDIDSKPIKEKKVNNKIKINPKLGEAIEELGGTLIEMVEVSEENLSERGDYWVVLVLTSVLVKIVRGHLRQKRTIVRPPNLVSLTCSLQSVDKQKRLLQQNSEEKTLKLTKQSKVKTLSQERQHL